MDKTSGQNHFTEDTVVADAIQRDPEVLERLIALSAKFARLRNPVVRRTMARLATLADAARIAGLPVCRVVSAANGAADAAPEVVVAAESAGPDKAEGRPDWFCLVDEAGAARLDVRPILNAGKDPLLRIMAVARTVRDGGALIIDAPFDPAPLRRVLARKGFVSHAMGVTPDLVRVCFLRNHALAAEEAGPAAGEAGEPEIWCEKDETHIDVRGLEPPQPMLSILRLLEKAEPGTTVVVHHERDPIFLYPELAERGWQWQQVASPPEEVRLRLKRAAP
jgi:uncharacterized protein (DUF2249 family)